MDSGSELPATSVRSSLSAYAGPITSAALGVRASGSASPEPTVVVPREDRMKQMGFSDKVISRLNKARASFDCGNITSRKWDLFESWPVIKRFESAGCRFTATDTVFEYSFMVHKVGLRTIKNHRSAIAHYWKSVVRIQDLRMRIRS